jgi:hypothetical protein
LNDRNISNEIIVIFLKFKLSHFTVILSETILSS